MGRLLRRLAPLAAAALIAVSGAAAGAEAPSKSALRAEQSALFQQLLADPADVAVNLAYARISAQLEDFEAAIATLERFISAGSTSDQVRIELGALYFKLGSHQAARQYFESVSPPAAADRRVASYLAEIERRSATHRLTGRVSTGVVHSDNATLGLSDIGDIVSSVPTIIPFPIPIFVAPGAQAKADYGARATLDLTHTYDLGLAGPDVWLTEASISALRYRNAPRGDLSTFLVRTGPQLSADQDRDGLKLRPYGEFLAILQDDELSLFAPALGLEASEVISDTLFAFGEARLRYRDDQTPTGARAGFSFLGALGAAYSPARDLTFRLRGEVERAESEVASARSWRAGASVTSQFGYDPGLDFVDEKWTVIGGVGVFHNDFDAPDPLFAPASDRYDVEFRANLAHRVALTDGVGIVIEGGYFSRDTSLSGFDIDAATFGAALDWKF